MLTFCTLIGGTLSPAPIVVSMGIPNVRLGMKGYRSPMTEITGSCNAGK